jgi:hypothetical protein
MAIKDRRPIWKRPAVILTTMVPLVVAVLLAVLATVAETPRLDATSEGRLEASLEKMTTGMSDARKKEFFEDCMDLTLPDTMKSAFQRAFLRNGPPAASGPRLFKPLHGMSVAEIHRKAEEVRRAQSAAEHFANSQPPEPLPGVPSPFEPPPQAPGTAPDVRSSHERKPD